jgi:hypothetical protein
MVAAGIPWAKLDCPQYRQFLEKYCGTNIPNRTTLTKNYLPKCYENVGIIKNEVIVNNLLIVLVFKFRL